MSAEPFNASMPPFMPPGQTRHRSLPEKTRDILRLRHCKAGCGEERTVRVLRKMGARRGSFLAVSGIGVPCRVYAACAAHHLSFCWMARSSVDFPLCERGESSDRWQDICRCPAIGLRQRGMDGALPILFACLIGP